ncbi:MAG: DNA-3-methyladenine glycosylase I [Anaerolineaceae bacterium]|nr:DNA-3-methyladenine glycosylase I [Anaerolineaceae bacterium]
MERCKWAALDGNELYLNYHDHEWGVPSYDDHHLFEMLVLESFHCGLSWLLILKKRENFRAAFDDFDPTVIQHYDEEKIQSLLADPGIVRHAGKIKATINNAACFLRVQEEFGSFSNYIWSFTNNKVVFCEDDHIPTTNALSDRVSKDLKKRGFKFMGSVTTNSYLEAVGVMNHHTSDCFKGQRNQLE